MRFFGLTIYWDDPLIFKHRTSSLASISRYLLALATGINLIPKSRSFWLGALLCGIQLGNLMIDPLWMSWTEVPHFFVTKTGVAIATTVQLLSPTSQHCYHLAQQQESVFVLFSIFCREFEAYSQDGIVISRQIIFHVIFHTERSSTRHAAIFWRHLKARIFRKWDWPQGHERRK